jgi:hypothetical protein
MKDAPEKSWDGLDRPVPFSHGSLAIRRWYQGRSDLHLGIELGAEQDHDRGDPEPRHEPYHGAQRPVGLVKLAEIGGVPGEQRRDNEPEQCGGSAAPCDPAPTRRVAARPEAVNACESQREANEHGGPSRYANE